MPGRGVPMTDEHKRKMAAGRAASRLRRLTGEVPLSKPTRGRTRRKIVRRPAVVAAPAPPLIAVGSLDALLDELRAIRELLDARLPRWSLAPVNGADRDAAEVEVAAKVGLARTRQTSNGNGRSAEQVTAIADENLPAPADVASLAAELAELAADDEIPDAAAMAAELAELNQPPPPASDEDLWEPRLVMYRQSKMWLHEWGSLPTRPDCAAPEHLLMQYGFLRA